MLFYLLRKTHIILILFLFNCYFMGKISNLAGLVSKLHLYRKQVLDQQIPIRRRLSGEAIAGRRNDIIFVGHAIVERVGSHVELDHSDARKSEYHVQCNTTDNTHAPIHPSCLCMWRVHQVHREEGEKDSAF